MHTDVTKQICYITPWLARGSMLCPPAQRLQSPMKPSVMGAAGGWQYNYMSRERLAKHVRRRGRRPTHWINATATAHVPTRRWHLQTQWRQRYHCGVQQAHPYAGHNRAEMAVNKESR